MLLGRKTISSLYVGYVVSSVFLLATLLATLFPIIDKTEESSAAPIPSETTLSMTTPSVSLALSPTSIDGTFVAGTPSEFTVITNNYTGYTLGINAKTNDANNSKLINNATSSYLDSISSATPDSSGFNNGEWAYKPNKLNSSDNTNYLPAPTYAGSTLDTTNSANTTANTYSLALAAKADYTTYTGTYTNTFVLTAVANPVNYTITYDKNTTDTVTNMPTTQTGTLSSSDITVSSVVPVHSGYTFLGWCDSTTININGVDNCSGNVYAPSSVYVTSKQADNSLILHAMWEQIGSSGTFSRVFHDAGKTRLNNYYKMQDMNASICNAVQQDQEAQLIDIRDNKIYWVLKAKDGKCWMTQNLDHDIVTTANFYTPENTNVSSNWTASRATISSSSIDSSGNFIGYTDSNVLPMSADPGDWYFTDTYYNNACDAEPWCRYTTPGASYQYFSRTPFSGNGTHGHVGNYYNWTATIAMNDSSSYTVDTYSDVTKNPKTSICPAGWRLPSISSTSIGNDYLNLVNAYGTIPTSGSERDRLVLASPLYFIRGGYVNTGELRGGGWFGVYFSSTVQTAAKTRYFGLKRDSVGNEYNADRYTGGFVRCVAETRTLSDISYMQEMTPEIKRNTPAGTIKTLKDNRDNTTYTVSKLADGNIWMDDNLQLDPATLSTSLSIVNTNMSPNISFSLPASSSATPGTNTEPRINTAHKNTVIAGYGPGSKKIGVFYNYCAASAGTYCMSSASGDAAWDICPSNWRMPTGGLGGEVQNLCNILAGSTCPTSFSSDASNSGSFQYKLSTSPTGLFSYNMGAINQHSKYSYFWTSTRKNQYDMYYTRTSPTTVEPQGTDLAWDARQYGMSVRCIAK